MGIVVTSKARCRDCYKCIRHCPVKAVGLKDGQAWVVAEKCILCGQCIQACPQKAKSTVSQVEKFQGMLAAGESVNVSLAPSYLASTHYRNPWKLVAGLYKTGVARVEETAVAAEWVAATYGEAVASKAKETLISSCCPVVVNLIEKNYPELIEYLPGLVSPMIAHTRKVKAVYPGSKTVFIGPCFAKKAEAQSETMLDAVLTFEELFEFFEISGIDPDNLGDRFPDQVSARARSFPLKEGTLKAAGLNDQFALDILSVSGLDECMETLDDLAKGLIRPRFIEALACKGGCVGGPALGSGNGFAAGRERIFRYTGLNLEAAQDNNEPPPLQRSHGPSYLRHVPPTEAEIREILLLTGKEKPEDETNCGGCGYASCREKAIAVFQGLAEPEMCVPYMKNKAESFSNTIVESTLNAIIVVNQDLVIQKSNPAAIRMFKLPKNGAVGNPLSRYLNSTDFQNVLSTQKIFAGLRSYPEYTISTRQMIYPVPKYGIVIGIITDITMEETRKAKFDKMRREAFDRASKVIHEQMRTAQEIAGLLGESTAETKATLLELMEIMDGESSNEL